MKPTWKKYLLYGSAIIIGGGLIFVLIRLILAGYTVTWTGFGDYAPPNSNFIRGKTLWDWMELLIIPLVLAFGALYLQHSERATEREIATDRQHEAALQAYIDRMADLLLKENLRAPISEEDRTQGVVSEVRKVARTRTLTVLRGLDARRKGLVLQFLYEAGLITIPERIIDLRDAPLQYADLQGADLSDADLSGANLRSAILLFSTLKRTKLVDSNMYHATLRSADLSGADLSGADLRTSNMAHVGLKDANLSNANLTGAWNIDSDIFEPAKSLKGAIMPNGTRHD